MLKNTLLLLALAALAATPALASQPSAPQPAGSPPRSPRSPRSPRASNAASNPRDAEKAWVDAAAQHILGIFDHWDKHKTLAKDNAPLPSPEITTPAPSAIDGCQGEITKRTGDYFEWKCQLPAQLNSPKSIQSIAALVKRLRYKDQKQFALRGLTGHPTDVHHIEKLQFNYQANASPSDPITGLFIQKRSTDAAPYRFHDIVINLPMDKPLTEATEPALSVDPELLPLYDELKSFFRPKTTLEKVEFMKNLGRCGITEVDNTPELKAKHRLSDRNNKVRMYRCRVPDGLARSVTTSLATEMVYKLARMFPITVSLKQRGEDDEEVIEKDNDTTPRPWKIDALEQNLTHNTVIILTVYQGFSVVKEPRAFNNWVLQYMVEIQAPARIKRAQDMSV